MLIGTGETHSVREFLDAVFVYLGLDPAKHVEVDPRYFRPSEVDLLLADPTKAGEKLGWQPRHTFDDLIRIMADADMEIAREEKLIADHD